MLFILRSTLNWLMKISNLNERWKVELSSGSHIYATAQHYITSKQQLQPQKQQQQQLAVAAAAWRARVRDRLQTGAESYKITVVVVFSNKCQRKSHFMCSIHTHRHTLQAGFWIVFFFLLFAFFSSFLFPIYKCVFFIISLSASSFCLFSERAITRKRV